MEPIGSMVMFGYHMKIVTSRELPLFLAQGWEICRKEYFLITPISDWWKNLEMQNKIAVVGIIVTTIIALLALFK